MGMFTESTNEDYYFQLKQLEEKYKILNENYEVRGEALIKANTVISELKKDKEDRSNYLDALLDIQKTLKGLNLGN